MRTLLLVSFRGCRVAQALRCTSQMEKVGKPEKKSISQTNLILHQTAQGGHCVLD